MNLFNMGRYHALVDYAHNPAGYEAIGSFVKNWPGPSIGVVGTPGDRRDEDFVALGQLSADIFDQVIIKEDEDRRGRSPGAVAALIERGISQATLEQLAGDFSYRIELDETSAINYALDNAPGDGLVVILPESVGQAISLISAKGPVSEGFTPASSSRSALQVPQSASTAEPSEELDNTHAKEFQLFNGATASSLL
jgi:cyanophycin synthetase